MCCADEVAGRPTPRHIAIVLVCAAVLLLAAAWVINWGGPEVSGYAFPSLLIGLVLLFIGVTQLVLWLLNRATG